VAVAEVEGGPFECHDGLGEPAHEERAERHREEHGGGGCCAGTRVEPFELTVQRRCGPIENDGAVQPVRGADWYGDQQPTTVVDASPRGAAAAG